MKWRPAPSQVKDRREKPKALVNKNTSKGNKKS